MPAVVSRGCWAMIQEGTHMMVHVGPRNKQQRIVVDAMEITECACNFAWTCIRFLGVTVYAVFCLLVDQTRVADPKKRLDG